MALSDPGFSNVLTIQLHHVISVLRSAYLQRGNSGLDKAMTGATGYINMNYKPFSMGICVPG